MKHSFEGRVVRRRVAARSKSEREAVMLETKDGDLVLRRFGGNAFSDQILDDLVGHRIRGTGTRTGYTLILRDWVDLEKLG